MRAFTKKLLVLLLLQVAFINCAFSQYGLRAQDTEFGQHWLEQVRVSVSNDALLSAALVAKAHDEALALDLLTRALELPEHDSLLLATAVQSCLIDASTPLCQDDSLFEELLTVDPDNLEAYLYSMLRLLADGNADRALAVLNEGMQSTGHNIYYADKVDLLTRQLLSLGYPSEEVSYPAGVYANIASTYSIFLQILEACKSQSVLSDGWKQSCLFLGARLQNTSKGLLPKVFGGAIQRDVLIAVGADQDVIDLVIEHNEWINKIRDIANEKVDWMPNTATSLDQPASFVKETAELSEFEAILRAIYRSQ